MKLRDGVRAVIGLVLAVLLVVPVACFICWAFLRYGRDFVRGIAEC